jgi:homoserine O-acetyltransferase/O-succinyltransferase
MSRVLLPAPFAMRHGGSLAAVEIVYETWGRLSVARDNALLVVTGLSPGAHAASSDEDPREGWWEEMVGPGKAIDSDRFFVICVNSLGSCHGSTGPASIDPATGRPYRMTFPVLAIEDIATAARETVRALGIERLRAIVGPSLGGMTALAYSMLFPGEVRNLVTISSATRAQPFAIAIRSVQREVIRSDPEWRDGNYVGSGPELGLRLARKLGLITYRSAHEWRERFARERVGGPDAKATPFGVEFQVEAYLEANARKFVESRFDASCYLYLSRSMDIFDVADHGGSIEAGLGRIRAEKTLVVGVLTDFLFPLDQQREIAEVLSMQGHDVTFVALPSVQGHDSFLVDFDRFAPTLRSFLATL